MAALFPFMMYLFLDATRGNVRFLQLPCAVVTTHFNGLAADFDFDGILTQLAVASCTGRFNHGIALQYPKSGRESSRPCGRNGRCQNL